MYADFTLDELRDLSLDELRDLSLDELRAVARDILSQLTPAQLEELYQELQQRKAK